MIRLFIEGGPYMIMLALLGIVVIVLALKKAIDLFARSRLRPERLSRGLDAILFWGCVSAVVGFLGQFTAGYLSLMAIRDAGLLNPALLAKGIAVSLMTTIFGLGILMFAALFWFGLRCRLNSINRR